MKVVKREASMGLSPKVQEKVGAVEKRLYISAATRGGEKLNSKRERSGGSF